MQPFHIYAGTFSPPTYGHFHIVKKISQLVPHLHITCGINPRKKNNLFTPQECVELWKTYPLPKNVSVSTLDEVPIAPENFKDIILVLGIRDQTDYEYTGKVVEENRRLFGIDKYLLVYSDCKFEKISSTRARQLATDLELFELGQIVSPLVVTALLEKTLGLRSLQLVVGKPASGKSTVMRIVANKCQQVYYLDTDQVVTPQLKKMTKSFFGSDDIVQTLVTREDELIAKIYQPWLELVAAELKKIPAQCDVFIEVATALQPNKKVYRFLGGMILYFGCGEENNHQRIEGRGSKLHHQLVSRIPGLEESQKIAQAEVLSLRDFDTSQPANEAANEVIRTYDLI